MSRAVPWNVLPNLDTRAGLAVYPKIEFPKDLKTTVNLIVLVVTTFPRIC